MKIAKSKITFIFLTLIMTVALMITALLPSAMNISNAASLPSQANSSEFLTVTPKDEEGSNIAAPDSTGTVKIVLSTASDNEDYAYSSYKWNMVRSFELKLNSAYFDTLSIDDNSTFSYTYSLIWTPEVVSIDKRADFTTGHAAIKEFSQSAQTSSIDAIPTSFQLYLDKDLADKNGGLYIGDYVDENVDGENAIGNYEKFGAWGLYMFEFSIQGATPIFTQIIEVVPDAPADIAAAGKNLEITMDDTTYSSKQNLGKAHYFEVSDDFKYVNRALIVWSAEGTAADGRKYVLTDKDLEKHQGENYNSIYGDAAIVRQGYSYTFDPPMEGTWTVTCSVYDSVALYEQGSPARFTKTSDQFKTFKGMSLAAIIGIVVAVAVAALTVVVVVVVVSIKKERVY